MMKLFRVIRRLQMWRKVIACGLLLLLFLAIIHLRSECHQRVQVIGYSCTGGCGGWADRQKGIVAAYVMAALLEVQFKIHMTTPCDLGFFLSPGEHDADWRVAPGELDGQEVIVADMLGHKKITLFVQKLLLSENPIELICAKYFFVFSNTEIVYLLRKHKFAQRFPWLQGSVPDIYRYVLTKLFLLRPGPRLVLDSFLSNLPPTSKLICAQIRAGGAGDTETFNTVKDVGGLVKFLAVYNVSTSYRFMFTSDKAYMVRHISNYFPALSLQLNGPAVTHVDRSVGNAVCGGFGRAIMEQQLLSMCHVLVISESGLAKIAAFLRGTDDRLFIFHDGVVERFQRHHSFPNRVLW